MTISLLRASVGLWSVMLFSLLLIAPFGVVEATEPGTPVLAPHRAVYEVVLDRASPGSGIVELSGRMVYEFTGDACQGYTQKFRLVTATTDQEGTSRTSDIRSSMWESGAGTEVRFTTTHYSDHKLQETYEGKATRSSPTDKIDVVLARPASKKLSFKSGIYFPIQHTLAVVSAARDGRPQVLADLYDGSETGEKVNATTTFIGAPIAAGAAKSKLKFKNAEKLESVPSWPITISFFDGSKDKTDAVPSSEQSSRFFANGVSTDLTSDYGDYSLRFELSELTFLDVDVCALNK